MITLAIVEINWLAVVTATVASMVVGALWYGPLFGRAWMRAIGKTPKEIQKDANSFVYVQTALLQLAMAVTVAVIVNAFGVTSPGEAIGLGFLLGVGLLFMSHSRQILYAGNRSLITINAFYDLAIVLVMSAIIGIWR